MSAGTVFVELDLDYSKFERNQQKLKESATSASLSIEKNFQNIGVKSDAVFNAMRASAVNSLEMIKAKSTSTGNEIVRAQEAVAARLRQIDEEQFGKRTSMLEKYKTHAMAAAVAAGYALYRTATAAIALGSQLEDASKKFGVAASELSQLQYVAKMSGVEFEGVGNSMKFLSKSIAESQKSNSDAALAFKAMGISVKDAAGNLRNTQEVYMDIADAFAEMKDGANKTALALMIFGRAGSDILPLFEKGSKGIKEMKEEAVKLGIAMSDEQIKKLDDYGDAIDRIGMRAKATAGRGLVELIDKIKEVGRVAAQYGLGPEGVLFDMGEGFGPGAKTFKAPPLPTPPPKKEAPVIDTKATNEAIAAAKKLQDEILKAEIAVANAIDKLKADMLKKEMDALKFTRQEENRLLEDRTKGMEEYKKIVTDANNWSVSEHQQAINKILSGEEETVARLYEMWEAGTINLAQLDEGLAAVRAATADAMQIRTLKWLEEEASLYEDLAGFETEYYEKSIAYINTKIDLLGEQYRLTKEVTKAMKEQAGNQFFDSETEKRMGKIREHMSGYAALLENTGKLFKENSVAQERMHQAAIAFQIIEQAMLIKEAIAAAAVAVANQGKGDPYTAFARIAAMSAIMVGLIAQLGATFMGGGGGGAGGRYSAPSTVLGGGEQSESIQNVVDLLENIYEVENRELTGIHNSVKELNRNIVNLTAGIYRGGGVPPFATGLTVGGGEGAEWDPNVWLNLIFGGAGLRPPPMPAVGGDINRMFSEAYASLKESLVIMAEELGTDVRKALAYVFESATINVTGSAEEVSRKIEEFFARQADIAAEELFDDLVGQYQRLEEGLYETAQRIIIDMNTVVEVLDMTGQSFEGTIPQIIAFSEHVIELAGDLEELKDAAAIYYDKFFTDEEKHARLQTQLSDILGDMNMTLPSTREGYRMLVEGLNLENVENAKRYVLLMQLADSADEYYEALDDAADAQDRLTESLRDQSKMIKDWVSEMTISSLAPVQSREAWVAEYERQKGRASAPGATTQDVSGYLSYAKQYLDFMRTFGGDYLSIFDAVMNDVEGLGAAKDAQILAIEAADAAARIAAANQLAALQAILAALNARATTYTPPPTPAPVPPQTSVAGTSSTKSNLWLVWSPFSAGAFSSGGFFHAGGLTSGPSIAGEDGKEWIVPTYEPERSQFLKSVPAAFWENLRGGGAVSGGKEIVINSNLFLDGKLVAKNVARHMASDGDLVQAVRRVI